jgi:hypothetical protein
MRVIQSKPPKHGQREVWLMRKYSAQYVIDPESLSHTVHATRPIEEGEEITISCKPVPYSLIPHD